MKRFRRWCLVAILASFLISSSVFSEAKDAKIIALCLNHAKDKYRELLVDFLEMHLLMAPDIDTEACNKEHSYASHYFRQEITEIVHNEEHDKRFQIMSALYDRDDKPIFSQVEFIDRLSRKAMIERAKLMAARIENAIIMNNDSADPFLLKITEAPHMDIVDENEHLSSTNNETIKISDGFNRPNHVVEFFLGVERSSEGHHQSLFGKRGLHAVTKPYMVIGLGLTSVINPMVLSIKMRGTAVPIELSRPLQNADAKKNSLKMVDVTTAFSVPVVDTASFNLLVGGVVSALYFNSRIHEQVLGAKLSQFWQLKEGVSLHADMFFRTLETGLSLEGVFYPFVQNFSLFNMTPLKNFGWELSLGAHTKLYASFRLYFLMTFHGENFEGSASIAATRVVSYGSLSYLGILMNL